LVYRSPKRRNQQRNLKEKELMKTLVLSSLARLHKDESGQGLVEYCLILALVAFAATAGMNSLASGLNSAFNAIGSLVDKYIT
jgi:pilus assembly protein Flp/PilA